MHASPRPPFPLRPSPSPHRLQTCSVVLKPHREQAHIPCGSQDPGSDAMSYNVPLVTEAENPTSKVGRAQEVYYECCGCLC